MVPLGLDAALISLSKAFVIYFIYN